MIKALQLEPEQKLDWLIRRRHEIDLAELEWSVVAADFSATDEADRLGYPSPIDCLRVSCHMTGPAVADRVEVGDRIGDLCDSTDALFTGGIGFGHMVVMARTADALESSETAAPFNEDALLDKALENSVGKFHHLCRHARHAADPKGFTKDEAQLIEERRLKLSPWPDGALTLSGVLDPLGGAALRSALEPLARKQGADDHREREQRLADALVELASGGEQKAQIQVTTTLETLQGLAGAPAAEVEFTLPVSSTAVERMACDSTFNRVLLNAESMVIDVGRSERVVRAGKRRALNARDGGCRWPGCDRPAKWSAAHHLVHWIKGGATDLDNLILLCHRHHTMVHEGGWQLIKEEGGGIRTIAPPAPLFDVWSRGPD